MSTTRRDGWLRLLEFEGLDGADGTVPLVELPEDLTAIPPGELAELLGELTARVDEVAEGDHNPDTVALATALRDAVLALRGETARREEAAAAQAAEVRALMDEVHPPETTDEDETPTEPVEPEEPPEDPEAPEAPEAEHVTPELVPVAAASTPAPQARPPISAVARRAPAPARPPTRQGLGINITAAADVPGLATGSKVATMLRVAEAFHDRARMMGDGQRASICRIEYPVTERIEAGSDPMPVLEKFQLRDTDQVESLVASGGFCGPLTPLYNICRIDAGDGLLDLPTVNVSRAGIQVPDPITMPTDLTTISWKWTNANDIAAAPPATTPRKPCITIPCPNWTPYMLDAYGICVTHGNLADRSFPELTREYISMVMNAHLHAMNAARIATIEAGSTAVNAPEVGSTVSRIPDAAGLAAEFYREKYHMATGANLTCVLPAWVPEAMRADASARAGDAAFLRLPDSDIRAMFTDHNVSPSFVQDWQPLANATAYPATCKMLIYPSGTWVVGTGGTLDLGVVRDSTLNASNDYTAAWSEDFWLLAKVCTESLVVTVDLAVNGVTACCP